MISEILDPRSLETTDSIFKFDGQAVTTEDFVQVMEEVSGTDLNISVCGILKLEHLNKN